MRVHPFGRATISVALAAALVLTTAAAAAAGPTRAWTHQFGRDGTDIAQGVAVDRERNVFVAGRIQTDRGDQCFVRKYLPDGKRRWMRIFGTDVGDYCQDVAVAGNGSIYVVGRTYGSLKGTSSGGQDAIVRKYRRNGSVAWTRQFGSAGSDRADAVAVDSAGNVLVAGLTTGNLDGDGNYGGSDGFVRKYRADGRVAWTRQFGTTMDDAVTSVAVEPSRRVVVAGMTRGSLASPQRGDGDIFVRKLRPNGNHLWTRQFGTPEHDFAAGLALSPSHRIYVVGSTAGIWPGQTAHGGTDGLVCKLRPDGSAAWTRQFGTPGVDKADEVTVDDAGRIYLSGHIEVTSRDAIVMKMKPNGSMAWLKKTGSGSTAEGGRDVAVDRRRHVYLVGETSRALAGQTWAGGWDAWIRKYKP